MAGKATEVPSELPVYLDVKQAAEYLAVKVSFVRNTFIYGKAIPVLRLGKRCVFFRSDLDAYMEKQRAAVA